MAGNWQLVEAQEEPDLHPYLDEKFFVDLGVYFPDRNLRIQVNSTVAGPSEPIDLDGQLGLRRSDETFSLNFGWRFGEKWQLEGQYFDSSGKRGAFLDEDLEFGDVTFIAGSGVEAGQDFTLIRAFFARRFESSDEHEFGIGAGLHWLRFGAFVNGNITTGDGSTVVHRESVTAIAPLPNIGAWYIHSISPKLAFKARVDWFGASYEEYDGTLVNSAIGLNYQVIEKFGIGLDYNHFDLDIDIDRITWFGNAKLTYKGPYAYFSFYW